MEFSQALWSDNVKTNNYWQWELRTVQTKEISNFNCIEISNILSHKYDRNLFLSHSLYVFYCFCIYGFRITSVFFTTAILLWCRLEQSGLQAYKRLTYKMNFLDRLNLQFCIGGINNMAYGLGPGPEKREILEFWTSDGNLLKH